ncbi:MAG: hypothetical protein EAS48_10675 [Chryseobacterium sp.]|nr:MAG: hypothetical protein EAS48_10675 [Chryseobacterium sp.]
MAGGSLAFSTDGSHSKFLPLYVNDPTSSSTDNAVNGNRRTAQTWSLIKQISSMFLEKSPWFRFGIVGLVRN